MAERLSRADYARRYGPTTGDRVRLADTDLVIEVERDFTIHGEELVFGGGKVIRDGMGQSQTARSDGAVDTVITNALLVDHWGIVKVDIGIKDGKIAGIGKAGNPDIQPDVDIIVGPGSEAIAGEGRIVTAGGIDVDAGLTGPERIEAALAGGVTTLIGGGAGPGGGGMSSVTPGPWHLGRMIAAAEGAAVNFAFAAKANASLPGALIEAIVGGAAALTLSADWGSAPAAIDCALSTAETYDIPVILGPDRLGESGWADEAIAALKGRTVHAILGEGGPEAGDLLRLAGLTNVLPSSHAGAGSGGAEDILQDMGALSMIAAERGGRAGLTFAAWRLAHRMRKARGRLMEETGDNDNFRVKRTIAKYTINPAIAHGIDEWVGSVEIGKFADLALWSPAFFGVRPAMVIKGGSVAIANGRPMFATFGNAPARVAVTFASQASIAEGLAKKLGLGRELLPVRHTRGVTKESMIHNGALPVIAVDGETGVTSANGEALRAGQAGPAAMAQRYFLY